MMTKSQDIQMREILCDLVTGVAVAEFKLKALKIDPVKCSIGTLALVDDMESRLTGLIVVLHRVANGKWVID